MGIIEEFKENLELNAETRARREAFDVVYAKCVDSVLKFLTSDDEDVNDELDTAGLYATYQLEVAKNAKSLGKDAGVEVTRDRQTEKIANRRRNIRKTQAITKDVLVPVAVDENERDRI